MSGIINDAAFARIFHAVGGDSVMQATVTAVYEVGMCIPTRFASRSY